MALEADLTAAVDLWLSQPGSLAWRAVAADVGEARWARARIDRVLDPTPFPNGSWLFLVSITDLASHATPAEKVRVLLRATVPGHDEAKSLLEPLDDALADAIRARGVALRGDRLADTYECILALALVCAEARAGRPIDPAWDRFLAADLALYDRHAFELTREALRAVAPARRRAIVLGALRGRHVLGLFVLDTVELDRELVDAALGVVGRDDPHSDARPTFAQGLARGGAASVPALLETLAAGRLPLETELALLDALGWIRDPAAAPALVAATGRSSGAAAAAAVRALVPLGDGARAALEDGATRRKKAVRDACAWLLGLLDTPAARELRRVRDAHAALSAQAREAVASSLCDRGWEALHATLGHAGIGGFIEVIDLWAEHKALDGVPGLSAFAQDAVAPWALAWALASRPLPSRHRHAVSRALATSGDAKHAAIELLRKGPGEFPKRVLGLALS